MVLILTMGCSPSKIFRLCVPLHVNFQRRKLGTSEHDRLTCYDTESVKICNTVYTNDSLSKPLFEKLQVLLFSKYIAKAVR